MLETQRGFLFVGFAALSFFVYTQWQSDLHALNAPATPPTSANSSVASPTLTGSEVAAVSDVPQSLEAAAETTPDLTLMTDRYITFGNDTLQLKADRVGGDIVEAELLDYKDSLAADGKPMRLLTQSDNRVYIAQSGLASKTGPDSSAKRSSYESFIDNSDATHTTLRLSWINEAGLKVRKTYRLTKGSHVVELTYHIDNGSNTVFSGNLYTQLKRDRVVPASSSMSVSAYTGSAFGSSEKRYQKFDFKDMDSKPLKMTTDGGWVAYLQHYFLVAWIPGSEKGNELSTEVLKDQNQNSIIRIMQPTFKVSPGESTDLTARLYLGPKSQAQLAELANGLDLTVDYGFLWWIGQPLFAILKFLHSLVGNWGLAIILVTVLVKSALYPLSNAQYRSFGKMRKLQPKIEGLKERYGDDKQEFGKAMMELYKKEKVNPLGGCLPLILQMPVFFALYWVLSESVEMRHSPFFGWIHDLAAQDPWYVLPTLMGISMFVMQKLQPVSPTMDPMQQKIMQWMPVLMTVFFIWAPAGLVLYWFCNNLLSIAQQTYITKRIEAEEAKKK